MIALPTRGVDRSITAHNIDVHVLCDWIEASAMFLGEDIARADVVDRMIEEEIYEDQDFASEIVATAWDELEIRTGLTGDSYGIVVDGDWVRRVNDDWTRKPAHAFCLLLSLAPRYDRWVKQFGKDYNEQGHVFELLTDEAIKVIAPGWTTHLTAWSRSRTRKFPQLAKEVAERISYGAAHTGLWDTGKVKDLGLDLLVYRPFPDRREGFPYFLVQCASGNDWSKKPTTPDLNVWSNIVQPATKPMRGVAVPFCLSTGEFKKTCIQVTGLFSDRCRLLGASLLKPDWVPQPLATRIHAWAQPRVTKLLQWQ